MLENKNILFEIAHPKHFHQFKPLIEKLFKKNNVKIIVRNKDVVIDLIEEFHFPYQRYGIHGKSIITKLLALPIILIDYFRIVIKFRPVIIISRSSPYSIIISKIFNINSIIFPDSEIVGNINHFVAPNAHLVITPSNFELEYGNHHYRVSGLFEETYLAPIKFNPDKSVLDTMELNPGELYFVLRFVGWHAAHDVFGKSFTDNQKILMVKKLTERGKVFISTEDKIPPELHKYKLKISAKSIHSVLFFASLYIGDSQTMATEAALLGTPSIRFNSFVGKDDMSNFKILEDNLGLLQNVKSYKELEIVLESILPQLKSLNVKHYKKVKSYFVDKPDVTDESLRIISQFFRRLNNE